METYRKPIIYSHTNINGVVPLAGVTLIEAAVGVASVLGFLTGLGDKDFHPEHARALTERKNFSLE